MTKVRVVSGAPFWRRALQVLAQGWSRTRKAIQSLWQWIFPPVPPALRRTLLSGLVWTRLQITFFILIFISAPIFLFILGFYPEPPEDTFLTTLWDWGIIVFALLPVAYLLWEGIQTYLKYRRMARWVRISVYGRCYEVPRALALRSAFLVPAILDYFHQHFNRTEDMMKYLLGRRRLMGGSRFTWQEVLLSPSSGRVYTPPRPWWQRLQENWNRILWKATYKHLHNLYDSYPNFEGESTTKAQLRKILALDKKAIIDSLIIFSVVLLLVGLAYLLFFGLIFLFKWLSDLLNINIIWLFIAFSLFSIFTTVAPYLHLKKGLFSDFRFSTYSDIVFKLYPMEKPLTSFFSSKKPQEEESEAEAGPAREESVPEIHAENSSELEKKDTNQVEMATCSEKEQETQKEPSNSEKSEEPTSEKNDTTRAEMATCSEKEQETQKEPSDVEKFEELSRFIESVARFFTEIAGRGMITALLMTRGHELNMDEDPLWAHSLGMGFLWDLPSDAATLRRYKALPKEAKGMIDAILQEVLRHFNNPLSKYTAQAYPDIKQKCAYVYLPDGKTLVKIYHAEEMSYEFVHGEVLPERSDYFLREEVPGYVWSSGEEKDKEPEIFVVGWDRGYTLGDYARLFRSSVEMKASFWAAYQAAWRLMRMVSEARDDAQYFGEPLLLPVRGAEGYVCVRGVKGFRVERFF